MHQLNEEQLDHFESEGYIILPGFFGEAEVQELLEAMRRILPTIKRGTPATSHDPWTEEPGDDLNPLRVGYINDLFEYDQRLDDHMRSERLVGVMMDLFGPDITAFQSATVIKTPQLDFDYHGWHQDMYDYQPLSNFKNANAMTYLGDMGPGTGSTSLVPRSHLVEFLQPMWEDVEGWPKKQRRLEGFEKYEADVVTPHFRPGDVLVFDSRLMHRANSNADDATKIGLVNVYQSADCIDIEGKNDFHVANLPIASQGKVLTSEESMKMVAERQPVR